jgi:acetone carboxylase gamma subunit
MTHTPLPWEAEDVDIFAADCDFHTVATCECNHTCRDEDEQAANAALIVRAVNSHHALVAALQSLAADAKWQNAPDDLLKAARAALAAAVVQNNSEAG